MNQHPGKPQGNAPVNTASAAYVGAQLCTFLKIAAAQLQAALKASDESVAELSAAVSSVTADARALEAIVRQSSPRSGADGDAAAQLTQLAASLATRAADLTVALQFYDKLVQRLAHVRDGANLPVRRLGAPAALATANWPALLEEVRACYSMAEERAMFDLLVQGTGAKQFVQALGGLKSAASPGELELF